jgi:hypothetical protein
MHYPCYSETTVTHKVTVLLPYLNTDLNKYAYQITDKEPRLHVWNYIPREW